MKATDILKEEHTLIVAMLQVIGVACVKMESGEHVDHDDMADMIDFIRNFADACHHAKEENLLFPALEEAGISREYGPIGVMLAEHGAGREFVKEMDLAVVRMKSGNTAGYGDFVAPARGYINLLDGHIKKENTILFNMADELLSPGRQEELLAGFERVERKEIGAGVHEKYHELLHRLRDRFVPAA